MIKGMREAKRTSDELLEARRFIIEEFAKYKKVGEIVADPQFVFKISELIRQLAQDQFALTDPSPLFVNRASAELGQTLEVEEVVNTMKAVRRHPGSHPLAFTPSKRKYPVTTAQYDLPFAIDLEKILRRQLSADVFVDHAAEALSRLYVETVLGAVEAAVSGNDHYGRAMTSSVGTAVDATTLDAALRRMGDINSDVFIAGRYWALFPITGFTGYSDVAAEEIRRTGMIGRYKGARLVVLRDDFNFYYNSGSIADDVIYLGGSEKGAWLHERDVSALDYQSIDPEKAWIKNGFRVDFGVTVLQPWKYHIINIT